MTDPRNNVRSPTRSALLLHGFSLDGRAWEPVRSALTGSVTTTVMDLPGHGERSSFRARDFQHVVELVLETIPKGAGLAGYSQGARVALAAACAAPERVAWLVLESAAPGLPTEDERVARRASDAQWMDVLLTRGMDAFTLGWTAQPLFAGIPKGERERLDGIRRQQDPAGLVHALQVMGQGAQPWLWESLSRVTCPTLLVTGSLDEKYDRLARLMVTVLPRAQHVSLACGHAPHVEQPRAYLDALTRFADGAVP